MLVVIELFPMSMDYVNLLSSDISTGSPWVISCIASVLISLPIGCFCMSFSSFDFKLNMPQLRLDLAYRSALSTSGHLVACYIYRATLGNLLHRYGREIIS